MRNFFVAAVLTLVAVAAGCYSNPISDKTANNANGYRSGISTPTPTPKATPAATPFVDASGLPDKGEFVLKGDSPWLDTGLDIPEGCTININSMGKIDVGAGYGEHAAEGTDKFAEVSGYPVESKKRYGLAMQITTSKTSPEGSNRDAWAFGDENPHNAKQAGRLWLIINDDAPGDNVGALLVKIRACSGAVQSGARPSSSPAK